MKILYRKNNDFDFKYLIVNKNQMKKDIFNSFKENSSIIDIIEIEHVKSISDNEVEIFIKYAIC